MDLRRIDNLETLKAAGIKEGEKWEFKAAWPASSNVEKTICALANTAGGIILIGVDYDNTNNEIRGFPGIDKVRGLEEKAVDIGGNINPRIIPTTRLIDVAPNKVVQVIEVFKSRITPHMASNHIYYQRADKENVPIPESLVEKFYLARQVQQRDVIALLRRKQYFEFPGNPHWLSVCFVPLYLETDLICYSRSNLDFLNSLRDVIDPKIINLFFHSTHEGYEFEISHPTRIGKAIYNLLIQVLNDGVLVSGIYITDLEPYWEEIKDWFTKMISFYKRLQTRFRYPGSTKVIFLLTNMRNIKIQFPESRMYGQSRPIIVSSLLIEMDFDDSTIDPSHPEHVIERFYTKIKAHCGLDEYIP